MAPTSAGETEVGSVDTRDALVNVTFVASDVTEMAAAKGRTEYAKSEPEP